jgi:hypothetical protein
LTLAGSVKRRLAVYSQKSEDKSYKNFEKGLLGSKAVKALTIDGDDKVYTTKADLKRAWKSKHVADISEGENIADSSYRIREHTDYVLEKINLIRRLLLAVLFLI